MKIKILFFIFVIIFGLSVSLSYGQTKTFKISFNSPPSNIPVCKTRIRSVGSANGATSVYEVLVPLSFEPEANGTTVSIRIESSNIIYPFTITGSATCQASINGFEVILSDSESVGSSEDNSSDTETKPTPTPAQSPTPVPSTADAEKEKKETEKAALDLSVPESPGFTILGLTPQDVIRPASPRKFATALLSSIDANGNLQNGIAVDTVPYLLLAGDSLTKEKYREKTTNGYLRRLFARTQFSLATTKGTSEDDKSARIGSGVHVTLFDYGDPRLDTVLDSCFTDVAVATRNAARAEFGLPPIPPNEADAVQPPDPITRRKLLARQLTLLNEVYKSKYKVCLDESKKRNFARSSFVIGAAGSWISKNGDSSKFTYNGAGIWTSLAYGFEGIPGLKEKSQLIFHFRRRVKEEVPDPLNEGMFITKDSNLFGMRFRFGSPNWTGNLEGVYQGEHFAGRKPDSNFKLSLGSDYKIADNLYLNFSVGGETKKSSISDNKVFVRTSFNWGTSQKPLQN